MTNGKALCVENLAHDIEYIHNNAKIIISDYQHINHNLYTN
jgi:hypothetical protein